MSRTKEPLTAAQAAEMAVQAFVFLAEEPGRIGRFLSLTGIAPDDLRSLLTDSPLQRAVLEHMLDDEALLLTWCTRDRLDPRLVAEARRALEGRPMRPKTAGTDRDQ